MLFKKRESVALTKDSFLLDPCKATPGYEFYPKKTQKIDLVDLIKKLKQRKYYIEKDNTPFLITVKSKRGIATIFSSLKIIIKEITEEDIAKQYLEDLMISVNEIILSKSTKDK